MLTVDDYGAIRRAHRDGMPIKRVTLEFEHSRNTIWQMLKHPEPKTIPRERTRTAPVLGPFPSIILVQGQVILHRPGADDVRGRLTDGAPRRTALGLAVDGHGLSSGGSRGTGVKPRRFITAVIQAWKHSWMASGSSRRKTRRRVSCEGTPPG